MKKLFLLVLSAFSVQLLPLCGEEAVEALPAIDPKAKHPAGVDLELCSQDPSYGYSDKNPIKVNPEGPLDGWKAVSRYMELLRDASGKPVKFTRLLPDDRQAGKLLDRYEMTLSNGQTTRLWVSTLDSECDPAKQPAPVGFYKKRKGR